MSRSGPNTLVVVGDTDWWDVTDKYVDMQADSRLRMAYSLTATVPNYRRIGGARRVPLSDLATPRYAELQVQNMAGGRWFAGVARSDANLSVGSLTAGSQDVTYRASRGGGQGAIHNNGSETQVVDDLAVGDVVGVLVSQSSTAGAVDVQFYVNGVAEGTPATLPLSGHDVRLVTCLADTNVRTWLCVDADDLLHLPAGAQPWGAAARVADAGGYSPAATLLTDAGFGHAIDTYGRTVTGANVADGIAIARDGPPAGVRAGLIYAEFLLEAAPGDKGWVGVVPRDTANTGSVFTDGYAYYATDGQLYRAGKAMAYGSAVAVGQRIGCFYSPATRELWFSVDGVVQASGDPEAGTGGQTLPNWLTDPVLAIGPSNARWRLCTHAREQLYRPPYAEAWDGADVLPEQHFRGLLGNDPYVERRLHLPQWGSARSGAPVGAIELLNADGRYDPLARWALRDQEIKAYELDAGPVPSYVACARVESAEQPDEVTLRVLIADPMAKLDVRAETPLFVIGSVTNIPLERTASTSLAQYEFGQGLDCAVATVLDAGVSVATWAYSELGASPTSLYRTVNPNGLHTANVNTYHLRPLALTNDGFSTWSGGNPTGWTVTNETASSRVDQSGSTARIVHPAGASPVVSLSQSVGAANELLLGVATIFSRTSGDLTLPGGSSGERMDITGAGQFRTSWFATAQVAFGPRNPASAATDLRMDSVAAYSVGFVVAGEQVETSTLDKAVAYVMDRSGANLPYRIDVPTPHQTTRLGFFSNRRPTYRQALQEMLDDWMVSHYHDADGRLVFDRLTAPDTVSPEASLVESDFLSPLRVRTDLAPDLSDGIMARYNWRVMTDGEIAGSVTTPDRAALMREYRDSRMPPGVLDPFYAHAVGAPPRRRRTPDAMLSWIDDRELFETASAWGRLRRFFSGEVKLPVARALRPGMCVEITHARHALDAKRVRVVSIKRPLVGVSAEIEFWG